jgi:TonB family protein
LQYPDSLRGVGIEGVVVLEFVIDTTGHVEPSSITVIESPHPVLVDIAKDAVLVSVYSPGRREGVPVAVRVRESLTFRNQR